MGTGEAAEALAVTDRPVDLVVALGGDGTLLRAARTADMGCSVGKAASSAFSTGDDSYPQINSLFIFGMQSSKIDGI